ncbi:MAG TPA: hypothetical protein VGU19_10760 [Microvirga sp.]|jgi:hypothetical protein|nr:hypothetical protein [Microvirga sp.]
MDALFLEIFVKAMTAIGLFVFIVSLALVVVLKALHRYTLRNVIASGCATGAILVPIVAMDGYPGPWSSGEGLWRLSFACTIGLISGAACGLTYWAIATSGRRRTNML